jgi:uncharacterized protein
VIEESLSFSSENVRIEARLAYDDAVQKPVAKVLLCPPHPFLGGDMDNNVLTQILKSLVEHNFIVFRFNYRGIGMSDTDRDLQEEQKLFWENSTCPAYEKKIHIDCQAAFHKLSDVMESQWPVYVIGYSFGCLPSIQLSKAHDVMKLGLISPPLTKWKLNADDLNSLQQKKFFYAPDDFACSEQDIHDLFQKLPEPKSIQAFPDADHFFIGKEARLADAVTEFLLA